MGDDDAFLYYHSHYYIIYLTTTISVMKRVKTIQNTVTNFSYFDLVHLKKLSFICPGKAHCQKSWPNRA